MKKQKIVITGGLGYIGCELCSLLSGEARYKDITVLDNRFISGKVKQLRDWEIEFIHGDILDKGLMKTLLSDCDVVYHLAGKTDVAYVATKSDPKHNSLITDVGVTGTCNVLSAIPATCKLVFPSTHVVYEGLDYTKTDIPEGFEPCPKLIYAMGKVQSERDIMDYFQCRNYIIVRLGSVYGYSGDTMRINIMPNLFSKITSQDGTINLFSGGVQHKSLVHVVDVVRAMKFLAESDHTGTYHLSNENMTIKQVAQICKDINPKVTLVNTADEIPNLGYTLSNRKLLDTGFRFLYNIKDSIQEMITMWSARSQPEGLEYIISGSKEYADIRGRILNYELTEPINLIGYIESREYTVRANHYHPIQEQKCLLVKGRYVSVTKDLSYPDAPVEYRIIRAGDIAVIRPNVAHTMVFLQDSVFLNLVRGEREHNNYGITHTIPYELVNDAAKDTIIAMYRRDCRCCGHGDLKGSLSLGMSPLANNLLDTADQHVDMYPLELEWCPQCYNVQLTCVVPPQQLFNNYLYVSSTSPVFREHFQQAADRYITEFNLTEQSLVLDIGSNDGVFLKPLMDKGIQVVGIEPAGNICAIANSYGIPTIHGYMSPETAQKVYETYGSPNIITASNVFAHSDKLAEMTQCVFALLKSDGVFIIEVQYLMDTIRDLTFDNIYHEHVNYWSVHALHRFFYELGYCLFHVEHIDTHGGSIRCYVSHKWKDSPGEDDDTVQQFLAEELKQGINSHGTFTTFAQRVHDIRTIVRINMQLLKQRFPCIAGYGSPAKATTALNYFGITGNDIMYTIEDNSMKNTKWIPGTSIQIWEPDDMHKVADLFPDLVIVFAWNFYDSIVAKLPKGTRCISIKDLEIPDMPVLDTETVVGTPSSGKVYDCFLFFNELDLLEMRLNILDSIVDYFVIVEANITHSGTSREYCFAANRERFIKWSDRIIYIQVDDIPESFTREYQYHYSSEYDKHCTESILKAIQNAEYVQLTDLLRCREYWQRESVIRALEHCADTDVIMLSDVDEIPNPDTLSYIIHNFDDNQVYALRQNSYYYHLNMLREKHWVGPRVASYRTFMQQPVGTFRHMRNTIMAKGGWHFSFQTASGVALKLQSYSHADMATEDVMDRLATRMVFGIDPFGRGKLKHVPIDDTYPVYLLEHEEQYKHMIL